MFRFSKQNVLKKNKNFRIVYRHGKSWANRLVVLYVLPQPKKSADQRRAGFVTGKKIGGAVVRNRAKRLMKEAYRLFQNRLKDGVDMVFVGRSQLVHSDFNEVQKALIELCNRAQVFKKEK